jgi:hypothetical protein
MLRYFSVFTLLVPALFLPISNAQAQTSIREQAVTEIQSLPASSSKQSAITGALSPEQTATMLQLEDPFEAPRLRDFEWGFGVYLSNYKPQGTVEVSGIGSQNLGSMSQTLMPSLSLGALYGLTESFLGAFELGLETEAGFSSQESNIQTANGTSLGGRLNSTLLDGRALLRWGQEFKSKLHGRIGLGIGRYTLTQTSDSSLARWSRDGGLNTLLLGLDFKLSKKWLAQANYRSFSTRGNYPAGLEAPASRFELGAQVVW